VNAICGLFLLFNYFEYEHSVGQEIIRHGAYEMSRNMNWLDGGALTWL